MGSTPRKPVPMRWPEDLIARVDAAAEAEHLTRTAWTVRALEAALSDDTHGREPRGASNGHLDAEHHASATGAASPRGASRPAASPRAPVPNVPGVVRGSEVVPVVRERLKPMSDAELRAWKRGQTGRGAPGVA